MDLPADAASDDPWTHGIDDPITRGDVAKNDRGITTLQVPLRHEEGNCRLYRFLRLIVGEIHDPRIHAPANG